MARPKSEDKKQALLEAATQAIAQSGIAASTAVIARNAGVAEGTLFRYFATKDELINTLYLHLKQDLCQSMIMELDRSITDAKTMTRFIWNSYISWGLNHPARHRGDPSTGRQRKDHQRDGTTGRRYVPRIARFMSSFRFDGIYVG
ncbi:tetR family transcriptional regulator [Salmonella enterica subsp. enterica]|uniref:TetR family transcriptional regulator n=1 Tax=Salmonella enterica I TaxID=59201 RepID=A0A379WCM7_SALET|nr:tetR family transcriptional regulator [Salmonella enterica subsp. enterica]